jgi:RHS repeat-associated protein
VQGFLYKDQLRIAAELDSAGEVVAQFSYGSSLSPDVMTKGGETYRFVKDHLGSIRLVVNAATGEISEALDYDEFGDVTNDSNPGFQPFGFGGGLYDAASGLVRFGVRDYYPRVGRWTAKDPVRWDGNQANLYEYVAGDPVNGLDPLGKFEVDCGNCVPIVLGYGISCAAIVGWGLSPIEWPLGAYFCFESTRSFIHKECKAHCMDEDPPQDIDPEPSACGGGTLPNGGDSGFGAAPGDRGHG